VTQIATVSINVRETCAVHFQNYGNKHINYAYRVFNECLNMIDVDENYSNPKKPTINLLPEHQ